MKLNHINLVVSNVAEATRFFETYFNFKCTGIKGENIVAVLKGSDNFTLVLLKNKEGSVMYPDAFHIGFMLDNADKVTEIYQRLKKDGIMVGQSLKK